MTRSNLRIMRKEQGFSMPEVLVSSFLLAMVVTSSAQMFMRSGNTLNQASLRDAVQARIAQDLDELRRETWRWRCEAGTGCTGNADDADKPVAYETGRTGAAEISVLRNACGFDSSRNRIAQTVASRMQIEEPDIFPPGPTTLAWSSNGITPPPLTSTVEIQRKINVKADDGNQLEVHYTTTSDSLIQTSFDAILTPEALAWCP